MMRLNGERYMKLESVAKILGGDAELYTNEAAADFEKYCRLAGAECGRVELPCTLCPEADALRRGIFDPVLPAEPLYTDKVRIFEAADKEDELAFIAAMITIVAYSINNTIIIFDRVRENNKIEKKLNTNAIIDNFEIADKSTKQSMTRTINTTVTTMFAIVIFAIIGTASVREFALPVIFGLIAGFYSSVFISPALYALMKNAGDKWKRERASKAAPTFVGQKKKKNA